MLERRVSCDAAGTSDAPHGGPRGVAVADDLRAVDRRGGAGLTATCGCAALIPPARADGAPWPMRATAQPRQWRTRRPRVPQAAAARGREAIAGAGASPPRNRLADRGERERAAARARDHVGDLRAARADQALVGGDQRHVGAHEHPAGAGRHLDVEMHVVRRAVLVMAEVADPANHLALGDAAAAHHARGIEQFRPHVQIAEADVLGRRVDHEVDRLLAARAQDRAVAHRHHVVVVLAAAVIAGAGAAAVGGAMSWPWWPMPAGHCVTGYERPSQKLSRHG